MRGAAVAVAALALTLSACAGGPPPPSGGAVVPGANAAVTAGPRGPSPSPGFSLDAIKGLSGGELERRLGVPSFRRKDSPAELWQYRTRICTLDLFLYDDSGRAAVGHAAVRGTNGASVDSAACLAAIAADRRGGL